MIEKDELEKILDANYPIENTETDDIGETYKFCSAAEKIIVEYLNHILNTEKYVVFHNYSIMDTFSKYIDNNDIYEKFNSFYNWCNIPVNSKVRGRLESVHYDIIIKNRKTHQLIVAIEINGRTHLYDERKKFYDNFKTSLIKQYDIPLISINLFHRHEDSFLREMITKLLLEYNLDLELDITCPSCNTMLRPIKQLIGSHIYLCPYCTSSKNRYIHMFYKQNQLDTIIKK